MPPKNSGRSWAGLVLAAVVVNASACASGTDAAPTEASDALVGGARVGEGTLPFVMIWTTADAALSDSYCTGSKVGERFILTAAHCVLQQEERAQPYTGPWHRIASLRAGRSVRYSFARHLTSAAEARDDRLKVLRVHLAPSLEACLAAVEEQGLTNAAEVLGCKRGRAPMPDVALLEVEAAPASPFATAPVAVLDTRHVRAGRAIWMTGYGSQGDGDQRRPTLKSAPITVASSDELRAALAGTEAELDGFPDAAQLFGSVSPVERQNHANLGSGDSGGPVVDAATQAIVGVNSDGFCPRDNRSCQRTNNSIFARIEDGWLRALITQ